MYYKTEHWILLNLIKANLYTLIGLGLIIGGVLMVNLRKTNT